jgi:putative ABC transport system substrate-binding protein
MIAMHRRSVLTLLGTSAAAAAWPLAARAQQPQAMPVVGYLGTGILEVNANWVAAIRKGLNETGYVEGRTVTIEYRWANNQYDRLPGLATELIRRQPTVLITTGIEAAQAAKAATTSIPIVFAVGSDPLRTGLVASLNRPGGDLTGVTFFASELGPKRLELLRELVPQAATIALLVNPTGLNTELSTRDMHSAARSVGEEIIVLSAGTASEIETAFMTLGQQRPGGLLINNDSFFASRRDQLVALAARYRVPTVHFNSDFAAAGGLMSYSDDRVESYHEAGSYAGRILKGVKPADLPVLQPVKFDFVINLKTAKSLGIEFPPSFHLRATQVIE